MNQSKEYWNYATYAAILIGICNVIPEYIDAGLSTTIFTKIGFPWKVITSFLILYYIGKKLVSKEKNAANGYPYGRAFKWCYLSSLLAGIVEGLFSVLYAKVLVPDYLDNIKNMTMNMLSEIPSYTPEMISAAERSINSILTPSGLIFSSIMAAATAGGIMSLIVAAVIKKNPDLIAEE